MTRPFCVVICLEQAPGRRFVLVRHAKRGWELPGGWVEAGEDPLAAATREFAEETGRALEDAAEVDLPAGVPWAHAVLGRLGPPVPRRMGDAVVEWRLVQDLGDVSPLSFPEDPYDVLGAVVGRPLRRDAGK